MNPQNVNLLLLYEWVKSGELIENNIWVGE